ncbi:LysR family transcriptional regulator [Nocardia sp. NPDC058058]|uniref:LysR family transcriptional regulator n=1 Tax=unclassified Nocardia TaxID=2637762 RepID=UPI0035D7DB76
MELRQLRYFLVAAEELHLGRAAARMHITQPAFTQQIRRLERELGVLLLDVTSHKITLTPAGVAFAGEARETLERATEAMDTARRASRGEIGSLSIGFGAAAAHRVLPGFLRTFRERYPDVTPVLDEMWTAHQVQALIRRQLHIGFVLGPVPDPKLRSAQVGEESFVALLPPQHPLAAEPEVPLRALLAEPIALFRRELNPGLHDRLLAVSRAQSRKLDVRYEVEHANALRVLVAAGHALTISSRSRARQLADGNLVSRPIVEPSIREPITMAWQPDTRSPLVSNFVALLDQLPTACAPPST